MPLISLWDNSTYEICAYAANRDRCQITTFLKSVSERERKKMTALLMRAAHHGPPRNRQKCQKMMGEDFWEFKAAQQRIFWCYDPGKRNRIVLLHGFIKKTAQTPKNQLEAGRQVYRKARNELGVTRKEKK